METQEKSITHPMTMTLYSGRQVDIFNLKSDDIDMEDIAHALANLCRFGGHTLFHYSVAQHSVLCSHEPGSIQEQLEKLLHDASEGFMNDLVRPIKHRPEFEHYRIEEEKIQKLIFEKYGCRYPMVDAVHDADNKVLRREIDELIIHQWEIEEVSAIESLSIPEARKFLRKIKLENCTIPQINPNEAKELFLNRFYELYKK